MTFTKGSPVTPAAIPTPLQLEDLKRHGNGTGKNVCHVHLAALQAVLGVSAAPAPQQDEEPQKHCAITVGHCLVAAQTWSSPNGAQGTAFEKACVQMNRLGGRHFQHRLLSLHQL